MGHRYYKNIALSLRRAVQVLPRQRNQRASRALDYPCFYVVITLSKKSLGQKARLDFAILAFEYKKSITWD